MDLLDESWVAEGMRSIPLLGDVAAGQPIEVFAVEDTLDVPRTLWNGRRVFALRVRGNSMIEAGIHDGDYLIVEPGECADNGRTVVAEVDGQVTVKKLYREPEGRIRLQPANAEMLPLVVSGEQVRVIGMVVGILRKYGFGTGDKPAARGRCAAKSRTAAPAAASAAAADTATLDLELNAIDAHLERWRRAQAEMGPGADRRDIVRMAEMGRDLQALRDGCARTTKPTLRRALLNEANEHMQRMDRFLAARSLQLPDATIH